MDMSQMSTETDPFSSNDSLPAGPSHSKNRQNAELEGILRGALLKKMKEAKEQEQIKHQDSMANFKTYGVIFLGGILTGAVLYGGLKYRYGAPNAESNDDADF